MKISNYDKEIRNKIMKLAINGDIEIHYYRRSRYKHLRGIDKRNKYTNGMWHVKPLAIYDKRVYILCPYCNQIHGHGAIEGHRVSHCTKEDLENCMPDYESKKNVGYEIDF